MDDQISGLKWVWDLPLKNSMKALSGMMWPMSRFPDSIWPISVDRSGPRATGSTHVRASRRTDMNCECEVVIWPPLRLARMRCERGSVIVVLPAAPCRTDHGGRDAHHWHGHPSRGSRGRGAARESSNQLGRIPITRDSLEAFARKNSPMTITWLSRRPAVPRPLS